MGNERILVVDDDRDIVATLKIQLEKEDFEVLCAYDGQEALDILETQEVHLILLDIMMPKMDGFSAIMKIRENRNIPILVMSAKSEDSDKILGLNLGADDYLSKPFNPLELVARINAQIRRFYDLGGSKETQQEEITIGHLTLDQRECKLYKGKKEIDLTYTEYKILKLFNQPYNNTQY